MLFSNKRKHHIVIPAQNDNGQPANVAYLVDYLCQNVMKDPRKDLFVLEDTV